MYQIEQNKRFNLMMVLADHGGFLQGTQKQRAQLLREYLDTFEEDPGYLIPKPIAQEILRCASDGLIELTNAEDCWVNRQAAQIPNFFYDPSQDRPLIKKQKLPTPKAVANPKPKKKNNKKV